MIKLDQSSVFNQAVPFWIPRQRVRALTDQELRADQIQRFRSYENPQQIGLIYSRNENIRMNRTLLEVSTDNHDTEVPFTNDNQFTENPTDNFQDNATRGNENHDQLIQGQVGIKQKACFRIKLLFVFDLIVLVSYKLGYLLMRRSISLGVPLAFFIAVAIMFILLLIKTNLFCSEIKKVSLFFSMGNVIGLIAFAVGAFLNLSGINIMMTPISIFGFLVLVGSIIYTLQEFSLYKGLILFQKIIVWLQALLIGLSIDGINISNNIMFIPLYIGLVMLTMSSVFFLLGSIFSVFNITKEKGFLFRVIVGAFWYALHGFYPVIWLLLLAMVIQNCKEEHAIYVFGAGLIHSCVLLVYTVFFYKLLCKFQQFEVENGIFFRYMYPSTDDKETVQSLQVKFKVSKESKMHLVMISPTFYSLIKPKFSLKEKESNKRAPIYETNLNLHKTDTQAVVLDIKKADGDRSNDHLCTICYEKIPNAVLMNCGHGGVCYECALENWKKTDNCLMCRQKVDKILKIIRDAQSDTIKVSESTTKIVLNK